MTPRHRIQRKRNRQQDKESQPMTHSQFQSRPFGENSEKSESGTVGAGKNSFSFSNVGVIQPKLTIGEPNDKYEQEADRVASEVVQRINGGQDDVQRSTKEEDEDESVQRSVIGSDDVQRSTKEEDEDESVQRMPISPLMRKPVQRDGGIVSGAASNEFESQLNQSRGGGSPLDTKLQGKLESAMGADFSQVRIHTNSQSDQLNRSIQAKAFTTGNDVFFRQGEYKPNSRSGQELIAHELTHVVQQNQGSVQRKPLAPKVIQRDTGGQEEQTEPPRLTGAEALNILDEHPKVGRKTPRDLKIVHFKREFSTENLFFLEAVDSYVSSPSRSKMLDIYRKYVETGSPREINISYRGRVAITNAIQPYIDGSLENGAPAYLPWIFHPATAEVGRNVRDSASRYHKTIKVQQDVIIRNLISTGDLPPDSLSESDRKMADDFANIYSNMQKQIQANLKREPWYKRLTASAKHRASEGITHG